MERGLSVYAEEKERVCVTILQEELRKAHVRIDEMAEKIRTLKESHSLVNSQFARKRRMMEERLSGIVRMHNKRNCTIHIRGTDAECKTVTT